MKPTKKSQKKTMLKAKDLIKTLKIIKNIIEIFLMIIDVEINVNIKIRIDFIFNFLQFLIDRIV